MRRLVVLGEGAVSLRFFDVRQGLPLVPFSYPGGNAITMWGITNTGIYSVASDVAGETLLLSHNIAGRFLLMKDIKHRLANTVPPINFTGTPLCVAASNRHIAVGGETQGVMAWDKETLAIENVDTGNTGAFTCLAFSPDGSKLAGFYQGSTPPNMRVWNMSDMSWMQPSQYPATSVIKGLHKAAFTADGKYIFTVFTWNGAGENRVAVYDADTLEMVMNTGANSMFMPDEAGMCIAHPLKPSSVLVGTISSNNRIYEYNCETEEYTPVLTASDFPNANWRAPGFVVDKHAAEVLVLCGNSTSNVANNNNVDVEIRVYDALTYAFKRKEYVLHDGAAIRPFIISHWAKLHLLESDVHQITGTVRDINNSPCARQVRAHRRSDGMLMAQTMSDAATGDYRLILPDAGPYDVQFQALDGENLNDLFFARSEPEPIEG